MIIPVLTFDELYYCLINISETQLFSLIIYVTEKNSRGVGLWMSGNAVWYKSNYQNN